MKKVYKAISLMIAFIFAINFILLGNIRVYAKTHQQGDNVVYKEAATIPTTDFTWEPVSGNYNYYIDDASGIPTGGGYYFYKYGDDKFAAIPRSNLGALIVNKGLGLVMSDQYLNGFLTAYFTASFSYEVGQLYSGNRSLGLCLNDISGCTYVNYPQNTEVTIPSGETNNYYNFYQYYIETVSPQVPDYITYYSDTYSYFTETLVPENNVRYKTNQAVHATLFNFYASYIGGTSANKYNVRWENGSGSTSYGLITKTDGNYTLYSADGSSWNQICQDYGLKNNGDNVSYRDFLESSSSSTLNVSFYDNDNNSVSNTFTKYLIGYDETNSAGQKVAGNITESTYNSTPIFAKSQFACVGTGYITIYKNITIFQNVKNNTYAPSTFTSDSFNDYSQNNDNSINTDSSQINNSTQNNSSSYTDASQSFINNYSNSENYQIDQSTVNNNTTTIINNYYGSGSGGDDNGGGDDDNGGGIDDVIWKALLKAIADFFKKIGELIVTVLTGIVTIFTSILDAIATIATGFTGITDFLAQIFGWLPSEIVTLMTLGLTTALFAAFLTWFKK